MYEKPVSVVDVMPDTVDASSGSRWEGPIDPN